MAIALGVMMAACSEGTLRRDGGGLAPDAADGGRCVGDLAAIGTWCPATFDGAETTTVPECRGLAGTDAQQAVWHCQDLIMLVDSYGLSADACYYDATSHVLVGAEQMTDYPAYCGGTSPSIEAGRTNPMCRENAPTWQRPCNRAADGGGS